MIECLGFIKAIRCPFFFKLEKIVLALLKLSRNLQNVSKSICEHLHNSFLINYFALSPPA